jgi:integrase
MARTRGKSEGSIFQRKDGRWCSAVDLGWENGKRKRKYLYGESRKSVADALNKALRDKAQGLPVAMERQTVSQFCEHWLENSVKPSVRPLTYEQYKQHVRLYIEPGLGSFQLSKLSALHVQQFINRQLRNERMKKTPAGNDNKERDAEAGEIEDKRRVEKSRPLSPRTVQITLFVLRKALAQAVKWDLAIRNVAKLVETPRAERKEIRPPSFEQVQKLQKTMAGARLEALFMVGLTLGMRRGEMLALRWEDINFEDRTIRITQALQRSGGKLADGEGNRSKLHFVPPKSFRGIRTIAMPDCVASVLRGHRARQSEDRLRAGAAWQDFGLVFTTQKGTPIEPRRLDSEFKRLLEKAELPNSIRLHDSRHFAASLQLALGVQPRTVMEILGHSEIGLTMNTYGHVVPNLMREAADKIDVAFGGR